jgi:hypothetical protein
MQEILSPDLVNKILVSVVSAITPIVLSAVWRLLKLVTDHAELKGKVDTLQTLVTSLDTTKASHDTRLALIERAVTSMEAITPLIRDLTSVVARLEALQENANRRLEMLENNRGR